MHLLDLFGHSRARSRVPTPVSLSLKTRGLMAKPVVAPVVTARPAPQDLRRLIFAAVASNDAERLAKMFQEDSDGVVEHAADWMKVPDALRPNPAAVRWYSEGLRTVAEYCAQRINRPDLFRCLEELGLSTPGA